MFERALTHGSHGGDTYERLEFLGDRVLGLVIAAWLYERFPTEPEGKMSRRYNALVDARDLRRGRPRDRPAAPYPPRQAGARGSCRPVSDNVVGDVVEALIGALFLDAGLDVAGGFIRKHWAPFLDGQKRAPMHPKSALQELAAARNLGVPAYEMVSRFGPHHAPRFRVKVSLGAPRRGRGRGRLETGSETAAAADIAGEVRSDPPPSPKRCGLVAVLGAPNAGKSTLVNALVGQKVAIVSPKAQTTRARLMGIAIEGDAQMLLVDTPGIFTPNRRLDRAMVKAAWEGAEDADRLVLVIDAAAKVGAARRAGPRRARERAPSPTDPRPQQGRHRQEGRSAPVRDAAQPSGSTPRRSSWSRRPPATAWPTSRRRCRGAMPESPWHFPDDQLTDATDRMVAAELTREQLYLQLHAEVPYSAAVETEKWEDRKDGSTVIHQQILIERDSQKAIILGKGGSRLKAIGQAAREAIAEHLGRKVHLFLHVKVNPKWDEDRGLYKDIGLDWSE